MIVHILDDIRHALAATFSFFAVAPNIGAGVFWGLLVFVFLTVCRKWILPWLVKHVHEKFLHRVLVHHEDVANQLATEVKGHVTAEIDRAIEQMIERRL